LTGKRKDTGKILLIGLMKHREESKQMNVSTINQLLTYSKQTETGMHQKAIQILLGAGNNKKRDSLSISDTARSLLEESSFDLNGNRQVVPDYAVSKMNTGTLSGIRATNNSLVLSNKSYYSWTASNGGKYTWSVNDGRISWVTSESLLAENTNQEGTNYKWEMQKASNILSDLAQGKSVWGYLYSNEEVLSVCEKVGISPGFFSIDAGAGKHTYLLQESGKTINVDAKIKQLNDINWIEIGYKEGDTFSVYGKEYAIDSSGHINVSAEDEFTSTEIKYPSRSVQ
jgi:hypothetical protein